MATDKEINASAFAGLWDRTHTKDGENVSEKGVHWGMDLTQAVQNWPAGPGEQHEWEPPRIATGVKDRVARLKALGNAVVPQQAFPIFKAIAETERIAKNERGVNNG